LVTFLYAASAAADDLHTGITDCWPRPPPKNAQLPRRTHTLIQLPLGFFSFKTKATTPTMFRGPSYGGRSRATATTLCQKCLKKDMSSPPSTLTQCTDIFARHYSYECKASDQERPYTSRPSRTQQLLNPKLAPKLMTDVPNDLLRKYPHPLVTHSRRYTRN
jgi:hypothetical protein